MSFLQKEGDLIKIVPTKNPGGFIFAERYVKFTASVHPEEAIVTRVVEKDAVGSSRYPFGIIIMKIDFGFFLIE